LVAASQRDGPKILRSDDASLKNYAEARKELDDLASGRSVGPLHIAGVASELASDDAIFTCGVGLQPAEVTQRLFQHPETGEQPSVCPRI
jgi:hypothetical protein